MNPNESFTENSIDQQTIESIIAGSRVFENGNIDLGFTVENLIPLHYGQKTLTITYVNYPGDRGCAFTRIVNTGDESDSIVHETTLLYKAARQILQELSTRTHKTIHYSLTTSNLSMKNWAEGIGADIFDWKDNIVVPLISSGDTVWEFNSEIKPEPQTT